MPNSHEGIWSYADRLPAVAPEHRVTMGEGHTPLVRSAAIGREIGLRNLYFKLESLNPTGSYKDRIAALALSLAKQAGKTACIGTSSGNAGASMAAYAARAGLTYHVYVQENIIPAKLEQILVHRARAYRVKGMGFDPDIGTRVFEKVREKAASRNWELAVTAYAYAPLAMEGVKTIAWEIGEAIGAADAVFVPVGGGGLFVGIHRGFREALADGGGRLPRMVACQSAGCSNLVRGYELGLGRPAPGPSTSRISGIQVPSPPDAVPAFAALRESGGFGLAIDDERTWYWQEQLACKEGIFCEPAGAIALAGAVHALQEGRIAPSDTVVCIVSGAGFKDLDRQRAMAAAHSDIPLLQVDEL
jgi:threonine synthase